MVHATKLYTLLDVADGMAELREEAAFSASIGADLADDVLIPPPGPRVAADSPEFQIAAHIRS